MRPKPLAEAYEKLKELRRQAASRDHVASFLRDLEALYDHDGDGDTSNSVTIEVPERFIRELEIRTIAERIFGDSTKAHNWLKRPSAALSGQRPIDLLQDELGAAVVREMLEQIDHGIFA